MFMQIYFNIEQQMHVLQNKKNIHINKSKLILKMHHAIVDNTFLNKIHFILIILIETSSHFQNQQVILFLTKLTFLFSCFNF
jgi:hypothetical protein